MYQCPKCHGTMRTYDRHGVHIEQCDNCRGVFLDYGELESLTQMEARWSQPVPPPAPMPPAPPAGYGHSTPAWGAPQHGGHHDYGHHGGHHGGHHSFARMLFSS
ncbi:TFIIB-type zinc ribbon-containing protein [Peterkaempfera griseoplana]|uniref:TFIIB-type zinc ribbon-containing protein n=1 Tax=Peterkaempfera griseoplana TaxID=66896 RepID=UPI0006E3624E|nr:zf-TFIIB domain-containing protein [Peterkaempfera griseoplana]